MIFGALEVQNFLSIRNATTNFAKRGLILIQGENNDEDAFESNGAGKSTLFSEAPTWVLFGETIRGKKADKVITRGETGNTRVSQELIDDNGDVYKIIRHRKHSEHGNHVLVFRNGENITRKSDKDTDALIVDLIQMDFDTFTNSIMFGQGMSKMFAISTDAEQKKILESILQIDIFEICKDKTKEYLAITETNMKDTQNTLDSLYNSRSSLTGTIDNLQEKEADLGDKVTARIKELNLELDGYGKEITELDLKDYSDDLETYKGLIDKVTAKILTYKTHEDTRNELVGDKRAITASATSVNKELTKKMEELRDIQTNKNVPKSCDACGQDLPLGDTSHVENHLNEAIKKLGIDWQQKTSELAEISTLVTKIETVLKGKEKAEKQKEELQSVLNSINTDIKLVESRKKEVVKNMVRIEKEILEQEELRNSTYTDLIEDAIEKVKETDALIEVSQNELVVLESDKKDYSFWLDAFGNQGIKSVLLDSVTPFLNKRANHYLATLSDSSISVKFNTQVMVKSTGLMKDKFSVEVSNRNGDDDYKGNSGGEKRRIDIAINMALQDLVSSRSNKRMDLIVYDECFEGLDSIGCESVIELLEEKAKVFGTVLVITHNDNLKQLFANSLTITKSNGKTEVA